MTKHYLYGVLAFALVAAIGTTLLLVLFAHGPALLLGYAPEMPLQTLLVSQLFTLLLVGVLAIPVALLWILGSDLSARLGWHRPYYVDVGLGVAVGLLVYFLALREPGVRTVQTVIAATSFALGFSAAAIAFWGMDRP